MKKRDRLLVIAILSVTAFQMGTNAISPILSDIAAEFPAVEDAKIQFLMTFPSLMIIVFSLLSGFYSKWIPKHILTSLGCMLFALSGVLSCIFHRSLLLLFIWAAIMGAGIGIAVPVAIGLISEKVAENHREQVMGWVIAASNLGAMLMTFIGGNLAMIRWNMNYLVYLIAVPGMILSMLFLRQPVEKKAEQKDIQENKDIRSLLKEPFLWIACAIAILSTMLFNMIPVNLSMLVAEQNIGTAAQAGTAVSAMLLVSSVAGVFYGRMAKKMGNYVIVLAFGLLFVGQMVCAIGDNIWIIGLGCLIAGSSQGINMARALMIAGKHSHGDAALGSALVTACSNIGGFCTPILTVFSSILSGSTATTNRFLMSSIMAAVIMCACFLGLRRRGNDLRFP